MAAQAERINPTTANQHMESSPGAMLVCAYENEEKFQNNRLEGAISLNEFRSREDSVPKDQEIIFYCA